ncbi:MAG TPA: hypothetical protein VN673_10575, partial [Clostridia bacterium]|nr:hypothetical protein [Clostridia bacterium]
KAAAPVSGRAEVVGVYPVKAKEPCHLIELRLEAVDPAFDFGGFTQPIPGQPQGAWQVPWMEVILDRTGTRIVADTETINSNANLLRGNLRVAFFMHYLDITRPLVSQSAKSLYPSRAPCPSDSGS